MTSFRSWLIAALEQSYVGRWVDIPAELSHTGEAVAFQVVSVEVKEAEVPEPCRICETLNGLRSLFHGAEVKTGIYVVAFASADSTHRYAFMTWANLPVPR